MGSTLHISLLGDLHLVYRDQSVTTVASDRLQSLLAYLVLHRHQAQPRATIAAHLWPTSGETQARGNLRNLLHQLRRALPDADQFVLIETATLQWNPDAPFTLDVTEFEAALNEANRALHSHAREDQRRALARAVECYRGDLWPASYDDWLLPFREALREQYQNAVKMLVNLLEEIGDLSAAIRYTQRLVQFDPLQETSYIQLMRLYALNGDRASVQRVYSNCQRVLLTELEVEPSRATQEAYNHYIQWGVPASPVTTLTSPAPPSTELTAKAAGPPSSMIELPAQATPFVGREAELEETARLLREPDCRLLTLVGLGGSGKSRLALRAAEAYRDDTGHQAIFVPLASVASIEWIAPAIADALHLTAFGGQDTYTFLLTYLRDREMLLVLDNFEHLLDGVELVMDILSHASGVKVLATSRERLNVQAEWLLEVHGFSIPNTEDPEHFVHNSSVALFLQSARRAHRGFALGDGERAAVTRICELVQGLPLGIEMAATWARMLSPSEIAQEIERSLGFLVGTQRNAPERHRSLRAVFDHSWNLLSDQEHRVLRRLSVFRGGFTRAAAEQIAGATLPLLSVLVDKSLLRRTDTGRYDLHELVRQFALSHLQANPAEQRDTEAAHSQFYAALLEAQVGPLRSAAQQTVLADLRADTDNIRLAWDHALQLRRVDDLRRATRGLASFFKLTSSFREATAAFKQGAAMLQETRAIEVTPTIEAALGQMLAYEGIFFVRQGGSQAQGCDLIQQGVNLLRQGDDQYVLADTIMHLGFIKTRLGEVEKGRAFIQEALELSRELGYEWGVAMNLGYLGSAALRQDDPYTSYDCYSKGIQVMRQVGDPSSLANMLNSLCPSAIALGKISEAHRASQEGLALCEAIGYRLGIADSFFQLGMVAYHRGNHKEAESLIRESVSLFQEMGDYWNAAIALSRLGLVYLHLEQWTAAQEAFLETAARAQQIQTPYIALDALVGLAIGFAHEQASDIALGLTAWALLQPELSRSFRVQAEQLLTSIAATPAQVVAAQAANETTTLDEMLNRVLFQRSLPVLATATDAPMQKSERWA